MSCCLITLATLTMTMTITMATITTITMIVISCRALHLHPLPNLFHLCRSCDGLGPLMSGEKLFLILLDGIHLGLQQTFK